MAKAEDLGIDDVYEVVTDIFGLSGNSNKGELRIFCPVHEANEKGHHPSCDINLETGYWNCFSCPASGDIIDLGVVTVQALPFEQRQQKSWRIARAKTLKLLKLDEPDQLTGKISRRLRSAKQAMNPSRTGKEKFKPIIPPIDAYEYRYTKDLQDRGFTEETLKRWNIRYVDSATLLKEDGGSFNITHAIAIPIIKINGSIAGWCYRATRNSEKWFQQVRYIYTPGITDELSQMWFGMNLHWDKQEITVVEGALDALWCDQNGIPAVAILGSQVKQLQKIRALMIYQRVILLTDRDTAGETTAFHLGQALQQRGTAVKVCLFPGFVGNRRGEQAKDAQDLCPLDLELVHARAIPFFQWKQRNRS